MKFYLNLILHIHINILKGLIFELLSFKTKTYKNEINFSRENFLEERPYRGGKLSVELKNEFSRIFSQFNTILTKQELLDIHSDLNLLNSV